MVATKRIKTYIRGLDEHLQGGIPNDHTVLIAGKPGTMKSSVAYNILYHNAMNEKKSGVYVTLEQSRESVLDSMAGLGMPVEGLEDQLSVLDLAKKIIELTGSKSEIIHEGLPVDDPKVRRPDISRAKEILGWEPTFTVDEGLPNVIEYFKNQS